MGKLSITIIEKLDNYTILECARCGGDGKMRTGTNHNLMTDNRPIYDECEVCNAKGKIKIEQTPPFQECGRCDGGGGKKSTCDSCDGIGVIAEEDLETY